MRESQRHRRGRDLRVENLEAIHWHGIKPVWLLSPLATVERPATLWPVDPRFTYFVELLTSPPDTLSFAKQ